MTEPLSVTASVAGLISLGVQVTQSLVDLYIAYKNWDSDLADMAESLESLQNSVDARRPARLPSGAYTLKGCHPPRHQAGELLDGNGNGNQVYVTDLGLFTERRAAQAKAYTGRS